MEIKYLESTQADFQLGTLNNVVATADGKLILDKFVDRFSKQSLPNYTTKYATTVGSWTIDATYGTLTAVGGTDSLLMLPNSNHNDVDIEFDSDYMDNCGIVARFQDNSNYYLLTVEDSTATATNNIRFFKRVAGTFTQLATWTGTVARNTMHTIRFTIAGNLLEAYLDSVKVLTLTDTTFPNGGLVGLRNNTTTGSPTVNTTRFHELRINTLNQPTGYRISPAINIPSDLGKVSSSLFSVKRNLPIGTKLNDEVSYDNGVTWFPLENNGQIQPLVGENVTTARSLLIKQTLIADELSQTPIVEENLISVSSEQSGVKKRNTTQNDFAVGTMTNVVATKRGNLELKTTDVSLLLDNVGYVPLTRYDYFPTGAKPRTVELWFNSDSISSSYSLFAYGTTTTDQLFEIVAYNTANVVLFWQGGSTSGSITVPYQAGQWTHVAVTYDGTNIKMYLNGVLQGTIAKALNTVLTYANIGKGAFAPLKGKIRDIRFWNYERTQQQITDNMNVEIDPTSDGLYGYWKLNSIEDMAMDSSTANNHGKLLNGVKWSYAFDTEPDTFFDGFDRTILGNDWMVYHLDGTGSVTLDGSKLTIDSAGSGDFWAGSDGGSIVTRLAPLGDYTVEVDVVTPYPTGGSSRLAMVRGATATNSRFFALETDSDASNITIVYRDTDGASAGFAGENTGLLFDKTKPLRIRLTYTRSTSTISGFVSQDNGVTWTQCGASRTIKDLNYICLVDTLHAGTTSYDNYRVVSGLRYKTYGNKVDTIELAPIKQVKSSKIFWNTNPSKTLSFRGDGVTRSYVQGTLPSTKMNNNGDWTIEAKFLVRSLKMTWNGIFSRSVGVTDTPVMVMNNNTTQFGVARIGVNSTGVYVDLGNDMFNKWISAQIVKKGTMLSVNVLKDGVWLKATDYASWTMPNSEGFYIGRSWNGTSNTDLGIFDGLIDQVRVWNRARDFSEFASDLNKDLVGNEVGLIGYWKLNEGQGIIVNDSSPSGANGTIYNADWYNADVAVETTLDGIVWTTATNGQPIEGLIEGTDVSNSQLLVRQTLTSNRPDYLPFITDITVEVESVGDALSSSMLVTVPKTVKPYNGFFFDGATYIDIPSADVFDFTGNTRCFTVETVIKPSKVSVAQGIVEKHNWATNYGAFALRLNSANKVEAWLIQDTTNTTLTSTTVIQANTEYHIAFVFNNVAKIIKLYVNGVLEASTGTNLYVKPSSKSLKIGAYGNDATGKFNGKIDNVRIWAKARTEKEIRGSMYQATYGTEDGLIGQWLFEEGIGSVVYDSTNNQDNGQVIGNVKWIFNSYSFDNDINGTIEVINHNDITSTLTVATRYKKVNDYELGRDISSKMTAYNVPTPNTVLHSASNGGSEGWRAFDDTITSTWYATVAQAVGGHWIHYDFGEGNGKVINKIRLLSYPVSGTQYGIKDFEVYGSNDEFVFDMLTSGTFPDNYDRYVTYSFANTTKYRYYRIVVKSSYNNATTNVGIKEAEFLGYEDGTVYDLNSSFYLLERNDLITSMTIRSPYSRLPNEYIIPNDATPPMTSYNAPAPYFVDYSSEYDKSYYFAWRAFDHINNGNSWITSNGVKTGWLSFDFGFNNSKKIIKYAITGRNTSGDTTSPPKSFTFEGSNNFVDWTIVDTRTNEIGWKVNERREYIADKTNVGQFRYYRINITANNGGAYTAIEELEMYESIDGFTWDMQSSLTVPSRNDLSGSITVWGTNFDLTTKNGSFAFNGFSSYGEVTGNTFLPQGNSIRTVEIRFKTIYPTNTTHQYLFAYGGGANGTAFGATIYNGKPYFAGYNLDLAGNTIINDNKWHTLSITYNGSNVKMYIDGKLESSMDRVLNTSGANINLLRVARNSWDNTNYGEFEISQLRVWNKMRLPEEIRADFNIQLTGTEQGLVGLWNFDEQTGNTTADLVNGKTMTLYNGATLDRSWKDVNYTDHILPKMTSANTPAPYVVSASTVNDTTNYIPWRAFDGINDNYPSWITANGNTTGWMQIDLGAGNGKIVDAYTLRPRNYDQPSLDGAPKDWTLEGSSDGQNYVVLDRRSGETAWRRSEQRFYKVNKTYPYRYYRFNVTTNNGNMSWVAIGEVEFYQNRYQRGNHITCSVFVTFRNDLTSSIDINSPNALNGIGYGTTDLTVPMSGYGDPVPYQVYSSSNNDAVIFVPWKAFNNTAVDNNDAWATANNVIAGWIEFDFSRKTKVAKYVLTPRTSSLDQQPKNFTFEGSLDGINYTVIDTQTNITGWQVGVKRTFLLPNAVEYRMYRLNISAVNGSTLTSIGEIELFGVIESKVHNLQSSIYVPYRLDMPSSIIINPNGKMTGTVVVTTIYKSSINCSMEIKEVSQLECSIGIRPNGKMSGVVDVVPPPTIVEPITPKDAFVRSTIPRLNYGTEQDLLVGYSTDLNEVYRTFMQFDLGAIPTGMKIKRAELKLYHTQRDTSQQTVEIGILDEDWTETGVTWRNQPLNYTPYSTFAIPQETLDYITLNMFSLVLDWYKGNIANKGIVLKALDETLQTVTRFASKERANYKPVLEVEYFNPIIGSVGLVEVAGSITARQNKTKDFTGSMFVKKPWESSDLQSNIRLSNVMLGSIDVSNATITATIKVRQATWSNLDSSFQIRQRDINEIDSSVFVNKPVIGGNLIVRINSNSNLNATIIVRQTRNVILTSSITVNRVDTVSSVNVKIPVDLNSSISILLNKNLSSSIKVRQQANKDLTSSIGVYNIQSLDSSIIIRSGYLASSMYVPNRGKSEKVGYMTVRVKMASDMESQLEVNEIFKPYVYIL